MSLKTQGEVNQPETGTIPDEIGLNACAWTPNGTAICTAPRNQEVRPIISDGVGGAIIVWQDNRSGITITDVYAQRVNSTGDPQWTANGVPICNATGNQYNPDLCSDGAGGAIITWHDLRTGEYTDDIYVQRINAAGMTLWKANGTAICTAINGQYQPKICSDGVGGAILAWVDWRNGNYDIYAQRINSTGMPQWTVNGVAICTAGNTQFMGHIISDGACGTIITWVDYRSGTNWDIYAQRITAVGAVQWTVNGTAVCNASNDQNNPQLCSDGASGAIITWHDYRSANSDIYAQRITAAGAMQWTVNGTAVCNASNDQYYPQLCSNGAGGAFIIWQDYRSGNYNIYGQQINSSGIVQWTTNGVTICTAINNQIFPNLCSDGAGGVIITWQDYRSGTYSDIYAQQINSRGVGQWTMNGSAVCMAIYDQGSPVICSDDAGGALIVWQDFRSGSNLDIYAQRINIPLAPIPPSSDPTQDEWPMFRGQLNHTGEAHTTPASRASPFWVYTTGGVGYSSPAVADGHLFVCNSTYLYCLNSSTGNTLWKYITYGADSSPAVAGGRVYIGCANGISCLNASTGADFWDHLTGGTVNWPLTVAGGRVYINSNKIYCINATTGKSFWNITSALGRSSPAVVGGRLYKGSVDYKVYCLNAITGKQLWNYTTGGMVESSPAVVSGRVYVGSGDYKVYCLNATTGEYLWAFPTTNSVYSSPAVVGGCVYVASYDMRFYCLNATTGKQLWNSTIATNNNNVYPSPVVMGQYVYGAVEENIIYCLNTTTGIHLWTYTTGSAIHSSPAVANGRVYISCCDGKVYCLPTILDTTPPTYRSVTESANPLELGGTETITIIGVTDLSGIQTVEISFAGTNHTMNALGSGTWQYNTWTPNTTGIYPYTIYLQDNIGHWNATSGSIQVCDTILPTYIAVAESADPLEFGGTETITILGVADLSGIQTVRIAFGGSNHTMTDMGGGTWQYLPWNPLSTGTHSYTIYIQDNGGNWNATSDSVQVVDTTPPTYISVNESADPLELGNPETITILGVTDLSGIQTVLIEFEGTNHTMSNTGGDTWVYNSWTPSSAGTYPYTIYIQDNAGNWNSTIGSIQANSTSSIPAFGLPLIILVPLIIAGLFIFRKRKNSIHKTWYEVSFKAMNYLYN